MRITTDYLVIGAGAIVLSDLHASVSTPARYGGPVSVHPRVSPDARGRRRGRGERPGVLAGVEPMGTTADFRGQLASSPLGRENENPALAGL